MKKEKKKSVFVFFGFQENRLNNEVVADILSNKMVLRSVLKTIHKYKNSDSITIQNVTEDCTIHQGAFP